MSRAQTKKQQPDLSKPIIKIDSAEEFFNKENDESSDIINHERAASFNSNGKFKKENTIIETPAESTIPIPAPKKQEIIIPIAKPIEDAQRAAPEYDDVLYKKRKFQTHYIRVDYCNSIPTPDVYEPTDKDLQFIKELNEKLPKAPRGSASIEISMQNFARTIEAWENTTGKGDTVPPTKAVAMVEAQYPGVLKDCPSKIYEYWKNLRELYQRPLLRKYLRAVNENDNNPNAAFRSRKALETRQINTRRPKKVNDAENLEKMKTLRQDLEMAMTLMGNIKLREMIKLEVMEIEVLDFDASLKEKGEVSNAKYIEKFKQTYENDSYIKLRKKMQDFNNKAFELLNKPEPSSEPIVPITKPVPPKQDEELNFDLGSFIATILEESLNKDITLQKVQALDLPSVPEEIRTIQQVELSVKSTEEEKAQIPFSLQRNDRKSSYNPVHLPPTDFVTRAERQRISSTQPKPIPKPQSTMIEEKAVEKFRLQRRMGRQRRVLLDRVFDEDEFSSQSHPRDFYHMEPSQKDILIAPEVSQKLTNNNLRDLYMARFGKFKDMWPYNDSEEENEAVESAKIKNLANNFKTFIKQHRPATQVI